VGQGRQELILTPVGFSQTINQPSVLNCHRGDLLLRPACVRWGHGKPWCSLGGSRSARAGKYDTKASEKWIGALT